LRCFCWEVRCNISKS